MIDDIGLEGEARIKLALVLLVREILDQLDEVASLKSQGFPANTSRLLLEEMCKVLRELGPELLGKYYELLPTLAGQRLVKKTFSAEYAEASRFAKERFIANIRADLIRAA